MTPAQRRFLISGTIGLLSLGIIFFAYQSKDQPRREEPAAATPQQRVPATIVPAAVPARPRPKTAARDGFDVDFFGRKLLGFRDVATIYHSLQARLPAGEASDLLAIFVAEGPIRNDSPEFAHFMTSLIADLRAHSQDLFNLLNDQDATLKQDPFTYEMTLNLVFQLDLSTDQKAQLFGNALAIHFQTDSKMGVTLMSANITNALILMKNSGVTLAQAEPYIQKGAATNQDDPNSLTEFAARANTYFPGSL